MQQITVFKNRMTKVPIDLPYDVAADTFASQIRAEKNHTSELLAEWSVTFATDGHDGKLVLTLTADDTKNITASGGFMDIKRVTGGDSVPVFDESLEVYFEETITD